jgi:hypothetical protein
VERSETPGPDVSTKRAPRGATGRGVGDPDDEFYTGHARKTGASFVSVAKKFSGKMAKGGKNGAEQRQTPSLLVRCQALRDEVGRVIEASMERRRRFKDRPPDCAGHQPGERRLRARRRAGVLTVGFLERGPVCRARILSRSYLGLCRQTEACRGCLVSHTRSAASSNASVRVQLPRVGGAGRPAFVAMPFERRFARGPRSFLVDAVSLPPVISIACSILEQETQFPLEKDGRIEILIEQKCRLARLNFQYQ